MKRVIGLVFICGAASCAAAAATQPSTATNHQPGSASPTPAVSSPAARAAQKAAAKEAARLAAIAQLAPADEYFGPLKQSIIGIRNTIRDLGLRYDVNHDIGTQTYTSAQLEERSIRDWEKRYPHDDQLPRSVYLLQRLYTKVLMQESRERASATARWLQSDFARSPQAKQLSKTLAYEHLAPLPPPTPTPEPTPAPARTAAPEGPRSGSSPAPGGAPPYESIFGPAYQSEFGTPVPATPIRRTAQPALPVHRATAAPARVPAPEASPVPVPTGALTPVPLPSGSGH